MENQDQHDETRNMNAFYASVESFETTSPSHPVPFRPSENIKKAIQVLQDLFTKDFSLLLHPGRSIEIKDILKYLLTLPQNEEFCAATKIEIQKMLRCFERWSLEHHNASGLSANAKKELSKASKVMNDFEANVKEFHEMDKEEMCLCNKLVILEERKRQLEEEIKIVNVEIEKSKTQRDEVGRRKIELYEKGREVKAKRDDFMINVPRLKTEQQLGVITRTNIEAEWVKLRQKFTLLLASSPLLSSSSLPRPPSHA
ncbi:unnamed protein product [Lathyrus oleraceus]|uniref:Uncharacterized protein n=1 Tax=Pisum sativum TaxID=3888 RepID=A0A9D5GXZ3_PEA|nr:uncharacterized protein LOC127132369 [Pisum sativum]XP_050917293.1 uncharacterized protein LOC127132388 [Pisum sativum]KAI5445039.1 hypothetical protein KIW84_013340 [Pisum sativum]